VACRSRVDWRHECDDYPGRARSPGRRRPFDDYGHGTHVAGPIGGDGALSKDRFAGSAPKARFVGYKVLDANGAGRTSDKAIL
jgi:subtilisin family serine protease